jgi:hypothetical protein
MTYSPLLDEGSHVVCSGDWVSAGSSRLVCRAEGRDHDRDARVMIGIKGRSTRSIVQLRKGEHIVLRSTKEEEGK